MFLSESMPYSVYSIIGEHLLTSEGRELDLSNFSNGVYIVHTQLGTFKLVKH